MEKTCRNCAHCIKEPHGHESDTGFVCDRYAPMLYACLSAEDMDGVGAINRDCKDFEEAKKPEVWEGHEYVREHARRTTRELQHGFPTLVRLVEIVRTQWDEDYFKAKPFAVRLNGEDFDTFATLEEARKCFDGVEKIYNSL